MRGGARGGLAHGMVAFPTRHPLHGRHRPLDHRERRAADDRPPDAHRGPCLHLPAVAAVPRGCGRLRYVRGGWDQVRCGDARHGRGGDSLGMHARPRQDRGRPCGGLGGARRGHSGALQLDAPRHRRDCPVHLLRGGREVGARRAGLPACRLPRRWPRHGPAPRGAVDRGRHGPVLPGPRRQARPVRQAQGAHGGDVDRGRLHAQPLRRPGCSCCPSSPWAPSR